ncbi:MAG: asparagine--tRNA ligase [Candidatus Eisenbacteria bacterium]|nr:asparagine--tRNA ligase [Candidatus Eisenbacteria bacterium]
MSVVTIREVGGSEGRTVAVRGWVYHKRSKGKLIFLVLRDGTGLLQAVLSRQDVPPEVWEAGEALTQESSVEAEGEVRSDRRAPGGYEMQLRSLRIVQIAESYPISPKEHGVDFLLNHRHLWLRTPRQQAILRIRDAFIFACREYLHREGFFNVDSPIFTPAACEGTTTLFQVRYFDETAYLSQSGQLYNEAHAMALGKVYCLGPTFRAEKSRTRRHLIEFWMLEPEIAFADLDELMQIQEDMVVHVVQRMVDQCAGDLEVLERDLEPLRKVAKPFPRLSYDEAVARLKELEEPLPWGEDFGGPHETKLSEQFDRPFFIHRFPAACKAFYMKRDPERDDVTLSVDMLAPEGRGEITGGGQREDDLDLLIRRMDSEKLPRQDYEWYLDLRRYGSVPHSGFGLGIERTLAWICGLQHIRETIPFPRMLYRIYP